VAGMVSISKGTDPGYYTHAAKGPEYSPEGCTYDANAYSLIRPQDTREYAYTALSRARGRNVAFVAGDPPRPDTDGVPGPDPEIARHQRLERERAGLPADTEPGQAAGVAFSVMAEVLSRSEHELSARETLQQAYTDEDHLARLGARWLEFTQEDSRARFSQALRDVLPTGLLSRRSATTPPPGCSVR
jgi:hypothetical protein